MALEAVLDREQPDEEDAAIDASFGAQWAMLDVEPTTVAGVIALLDYMTEFSANGYRGWSDRDAEPGEKASLGSVSFKDDAMHFASRSLKRLLAA